MRSGLNVNCWAAAIASPDHTGATDLGTQLLDTVKLRPQ